MRRTTRFPAREGLAARVAGFVAHLRENGFPLGPAGTADALAALGLVAAADPAEARLALRVAMVRSRDQWDRFDALFDAFWHRTGRERAVGPAPASGGAGGLRLMPPPESVRQGGAAPGSGGAEAGGLASRRTAAEAESFAARDLSRLADPDEIRRAERVAAALARALRDRTCRRRRAHLRGGPDLRRTLRACIARGGEPIDLFRRRRREPPLRIVALLDVSGSMTVHARVFLAFLRGLMAADLRTDLYLFHTRLLRITEAVRDRHALRAADRLSLMAEGFGGGTRIGAALGAFADGYAPRALDGRSALLILSDGYDAGPPGAVAAALGRLRRRAGRIIWLTPVRGEGGRAIAAARPFLDACLPAASLDDLAALGTAFARL